ncbi:MAG: response regulator [Rhodospirillales bacterium]|jgi:HD-like signal output (HDOD) protein/CheY-like chemotaxis protein|nr:response regulator [Rhodospirillales bacterium]
MTSTILFVDDDENVLKGLRRMLHPMRESWNMEFVDGAEKALMAMSERPFDVVVSDLRMPGVDGAELLTIVSKTYPSSVRIILSGYAEEEAILRTAGPAHRYLSKPCDFDCLVEAVSSAVALRRFLDNEGLRQLVSSLHSLPSPPDVFLALLEELRSKNASSASVAQILSRDVAMTAETLKLTNSAFFGLPTRITDLKDAVRLLGLDTIKALTLMAGIYSRYSGDTATAAIIRRLGNRSLGVGLAARTIAELEHLDSASVQEAMCAGVLAHVGVLVLVANFPLRFRRAVNQVENGVQPIFEAEREMFGASHTELSAYLLGLWGFVDSVVEAVAHHHEPRRYKGQSQLVGIVHCAQALAKTCGEAMTSGDVDSLDDIALRSGLDMDFLTASEMVDRLPDWRMAVDGALRRGASQ